jgi:hypothetical protein
MDVIMTEEPFDEAMTKGCEIHRIGRMDRGEPRTLCSIRSITDASRRQKGMNRLLMKQVYLTWSISLNQCDPERDPVAPVEVGHRTCTTCTLGNIAYELMRPVNGIRQRNHLLMIRKPEKFYHREYRPGYSLYETDHYAG